ncbi:Transposon TX1 uncharacterized protein [Nymphaea thermarum]|nr:Transposon TX1 uncharacterized protein [Nymphaea thermarum]
MHIVLPFTLKAPELKTLAWACWSRYTGSAFLSGGPVDPQPRWYAASVFFDGQAPTFTAPTVASLTVEVSPTFAMDSFTTDLSSLHLLLHWLSRGSSRNLACLPLPPVSPALPHIPFVDTFSPALRLPPVAPLLDAELGISLPDALAALQVSLPLEKLELLRSYFVAVVAPVSHSSLARLRRELRRIGASAASIPLLVLLGRPGVRRITWFPHEGSLLECAGPGCSLSGPSMSTFRSFVDEFGLFDVPLNNGKFTWSNNRNSLILRRLDRVFLSPELFSAFPSSSLVLGLRHLSDHALLLLSLLRGRAGTERTRFRFELWWLLDESFVAVVPNWWAHTVNGSGKFSEVSVWDEEILSLQSSDNILADQSSRLLCLQCLAQEWRIRESIHWQQRSRLGWLVYGDQNSRFFHLVASQRCRQTLLQSMAIGHDVFLGDDILSALTAHFRDFYSKPLHFRAPLPDFHLSSLSVSCAISLERPFLHQEIKNVVWALGSGKAPDIDGFPIEFFRTFWDACSADVYAFCDEFASSSILLKEFNQATCVLLPKRRNPTDVTHFLPISILGTPYKIIAKLLSLRLAPVMPSIINPFQVAFIKGRRLQDAVVLANEVVHSFYCLRLPSFILKLDISKTFDSVSWEFLSDLFTCLAFGPSFREWILSLVTGAQLAVSFNGKCGGLFCLGRGLR